MFAGIQIAFSDAIRVGDVVVLEDEWGRIEEISLTYAVVHLWDGRVGVLQVTDAVDCVRVRMLASASNAPDLFDLHRPPERSRSRDPTAQRRGRAVDQPDEKVDIDR